MLMKSAPADFSVALAPFSKTIIIHAKLTTYGNKFLQLNANFFIVLYALSLNTAIMLFWEGDQ